MFDYVDVDRSKKDIAFIEVYRHLNPSEIRDEDDNHRIVFGHWEAVSPEAFDWLTPEQRWEYQKWVWGAPKRWVQRLYERLR